MTVYVMQGVSGSGKSTEAARIVKECGALHSGMPRAVVLSTDHYFIHSGSYVFRPDMLEDAHNDCLARFVSLLIAGQSDVIVDNTNLTVAECAPYVALGKAKGHAVVIVRMHCPWEIAASRNVHDVPKVKVETQQKRLDNFRFPAFWRNVTLRKVLLSSTGQTLAEVNLRGGDIDGHDL